MNVGVERKFYAQYIENRGIFRLVIINYTVLKHTWCSLEIGKILFLPLELSEKIKYRNIYKLDLQIKE